MRAPARTCACVPGVSQSDEDCIPVHELFTDVVRPSSPILSDDTPSCVVAAAPVDPVDDPSQPEPTDTNVRVWMKPSLSRVTLTLGAAMCFRVNGG